MESAGTDIYCVETFFIQNWFHNDSREPEQFRTIVAPAHIYGNFEKRKKTPKAGEKSSSCLKNFFVVFRFEQFMRN